MKVTFLVNLEVDEALIALDSKRYGRPEEQLLREVVSDCECRLFDSVRYRDGVARVGTQLLIEPEVTRQ